MGYSRMTDLLQKITDGNESVRKEPSPVIYMYNEDFVHILNTVKMIQSELLKKSAKYFEITQYLLKALFMCIARSSMLNVVSKKSIRSEELTHNVLVYIENHYNENITLETISQLYGYNPSYFSRFFKKNFGINFHRYITELRIKNAIELLKSTNYSTEKISQIVGYSSRELFCKNFKEVKGRTLTEYLNKRKQWIKESLKPNDSDYDKTFQ